MSLKSRYRLMRMRSRLSSGRARRRVLMVLLLIAGAFVMFAGVVMVLIIVCAAVVFLAALSIWNLFSRHGARRDTKVGPGGDFGTGVTLEGEYTVQDSDSAKSKDKH